jgi:4-hydroxy-3-polyprenylbenzoate decarboxylase
LKEGRRLIVVPRETPLSSIHLDNMLRLSRAGARIVPAMPGFYHRPASLEALIDMMVMKVLDQMGIHDAGLAERWKESSAPVDAQRVVVGFDKFLDE